MIEYFETIFNGVKTFIVGMKMTMKHFNNKEELVATLQYPHEKWPIPERNIGFDHSEYNEIRSRLHVDIDDCIGCLQCEKVCPVDCIKIDTIKPPKGVDIDLGMTSNNTELKMLVTRFSIDMSECMYCNLCVYPCPEECIYMVGGPNEKKHAIDYEFSQYQRDGLLFEFATATEEKIIEVGGEDYLDNLSIKKEKLESGSRLEGIVQAEIVVTVNSDSIDKVSEPKEEVDLGLSHKVFNNVNDKFARGVAKKAFHFGKRADMEYTQMADYILSAILDANRTSDEMAAAINEIRNYKPEEILKSESIDVELSEVVKEISEEKSDKVSTSVFDIKTLNDIEDKMTRGIAKKSFTAGKRQGLDDAGKANLIISDLKESDKLTGEIESMLSSFLSIPETQSVSVDIKEEVLFDIKKLNDIEDKMARGSAKKIYMAGKRAGTSSSDVVSEIENKLSENGLLDDNTKNILKGI